MNNAEEKVSKLEGFIEVAAKRGCYTASQEGSMKSALSLAIAQVPAEEREDFVSSTSVATFKDRAPKLLDMHGATTSAKHSSVTVYKARIKKLVEDFTRWNGGDFLKWKAELEKKGTATRKSKKRAKSDVVSHEQVGTRDTVDHEILLPKGRRAWLQVPDDLGTADIEKVWQQLEALKAVLQLRAEITGADEDEPPESS